MNDEITQYINQFEGLIKERLIQMREIIKKTVPEAKQVISYQMPAFQLNGIIVYFAAQKKHLGFYPHGEAILEFADQIKDYKHSKGAIQFPYQEELPLKLIESIVKYNVNKNNLKSIKNK